MSQSEHSLPQFPVVGIGGSAGGLGAFERLFDTLAADTGAAFVVIQHLSADQPSQLPDILGRHTRMPVTAARDGMKLEPDHVYIAPPGQELQLNAGALCLLEPESAQHTPGSIDRFFRSLANECGSNAIGVVFSGMGDDGTLGLKAIKSAGGTVLVQDPDTAAFDAMPRSAAATHMADLILAVEEIAKALQGVIARNGEQEPVFTEEWLEPIFELLRRNRRHEFRGYKRPMISRRIVRRMSLTGVEGLDNYVALLQEKPEELEALHRDLLISVTDFFRDPDAYASLRTHVLPNLPAQQDENYPIRAWVPACATGEEAYSIAMLLSESLADKELETGLQVFASDIDERALDIARIGLYPESIATDLPTHHLQRFFKQIDHHYQVADELRHGLVFAQQDLLRDPPYSRLDLISCRNLLIYLSPEMQQYVLALFHFALRDEGYLFLGNAETIGQAQDLFEPVDQRHRIYRRIAGAVREQHHFQFAHSAGRRAPNLPMPQQPASRRPDVDQIAQQLLLRDYVPASVLINRKAEVLCSYGPTQRYLSLPTGASRLELMDMVAQDLRNKLRAVTFQAIRENHRCHVSVLRNETEQGSYSVRITARPLARPASAQGLLLITFEETPIAPSTASAQIDGDTVENQMAEELRATREELQGTISSLEATNEDLQGSNEEVMSMNEELQSTNEELETSQEELQSLNEELSTVNHELRDKIRETERAKNDLANLFSGTRVATLFLDRQLCIKRYTPAIQGLLNLLSSDIGRPLRDIKLKFDDPSLLDDALDVLEHLSQSEREVQAEDGRWHIRRVLPYRTLDESIDGVVITFADITDLKQAMTSAQRNEMRLQLLADSLPALIAYVTADLRFDFINATYRDWFGIRPESLHGRRLEELLGQAHFETIRKHCESALAGRRVSYEDRYEHRQLGMRSVQITHVPYAASDEQAHGFYLLATDISESKEQEDKLIKRQDQAAHANRAASMSELAATISHQLNQPLGSINTYAGALRRLLEEEGDSEARAVAEKISVQARTAGDILKELREFIGRRTFDQDNVDLNNLVHRVLTLTEARTMAANADVHLQLAPQLPEIHGSPIQLEQMLVNLVVNALEAMQDVADERALTITTEVQKRQLHLSVSDTGAGISAELLNQIFDAFFTSKPDGMGMGLTVSRGIVEEHGGQIWAESNAQKGTTFHVRLPANGTH